MRYKLFGGATDVIKNAQYEQMIAALNQAPDACVKCDYCQCRLSKDGSSILCLCRVAKHKQITIPTTVPVWCPLNVHNDDF